VHLWRKRAGEWCCVPLASRLAFGRTPSGIAVGADAEEPLASIVAYSENGAPRAALIAPASARVRVNGYPSLGVVVLEDRDEISVAGTRFLFAARSATAAAPFASGRTKTRCARCTRVLHAGDMVAGCAGCGATHHEGALAAPRHAVLSCLTYDPACGGCGRRWSDLLWAPEEEDDA
jgi:hypothetical protein